MDLSRFAMPLLRRVDPEIAHDATIWGLRHGFGPVLENSCDESLHCRLWGLDFTNPIGISAGFD